jgi:hypothetical protein
MHVWWLKKFRCPVAQQCIAVLNNFTTFRLKPGLGTRLDWSSGLRCLSRQVTQNKFNMSTHQKTSNSTLAVSDILLWYSFLKNRSSYFLILQYTALNGRLIDIGRRSSFNFSTGWIGKLQQLTGLFIDPSDSATRL